MVEAHQVHLGQRCAQAGRPPGIAGLFRRGPIVDWVAPKLAGGAEIIGRHAGIDQLAAVAVEQEQMRVRPDVGGIVRSEKGGIADDFHAALAGMTSQRVPLAEEEELPELLPADGLRKLSSGRGQRLGLARPQRRGPILPAGAALVLLQGHEEGVVIEPIQVALTEILE